MGDDEHWQLAGRRPLAADDDVMGPVHRTEARTVLQSPDEGAGVIAEQEPAASGPADEEETATKQPKKKNPFQRFHSRLQSSSFKIKDFFSDKADRAATSIKNAFYPKSG